MTRPVKNPYCNNNDRQEGHGNSQRCESEKYAAQEHSLRPKLFELSGQHTIDGASQEHRSKALRINESGDKNTHGINGPYNSRQGTDNFATDTSSDLSHDYRQKRSDETFHNPYGDNALPEQPIHGGEKHRIAGCLAEICAEFPGG